MKPGSLTTRLLVVSGLVLLMFGGATLGLMYRAQTQLSLQAMDSLLKDDAFSLSALVNAVPNEKFDFEITPLALSNYQNSQTGEFFRFFDMSTGQPLRESLGAPEAPCELKDLGSSFGDRMIAGHSYRTRTVAFRPEIDIDFKNRPPFPRGRICLVVGVDQAQYLGFVHQTFLSAIPVLIALILIFMGLLFALLRILMRDLSRLNESLQTADFAATHAFPELPKAQTQEVKAVVEKLQNLHGQAASAYREMWLFLGRAAHQLKTPVAAIQATLQVTLRKDRTKEELIASMEDLGSAVDLLSSLTQKLISSTRISYQSLPQNEPIDLQSFIADQIKIFHSRAEQRQIKIQTEPSPFTRVLASKPLLSEILGNLIENAILYSHSEGCVSISWTQNAANAVIQIRDNGPGFPERVKASLFEPFVRGDERKTIGSGLGLSIAGKSAQLLNGSVSLQESGPSGSALRVTLPLA